MKYRNLLIFTLTLSGMIFTPLSPVVAEQALPAEPDAGAVLCSPGIYLDMPDDCFPLGPSETLTNFARQGLFLPLLPLPSRKPDPTLNDVPYLYFKVDQTGTGFYPSLGAAISKGGAARYLPPGSTLYVTYVDRVEGQKGGVYYMLPTGEWMHGDGSRVSVPVFQGIELTATPRNSFGWVLSNADVRRAPNFNFDNPVINTIYRSAIVQVYKQETDKDGYVWLMIGQDQWVEDRVIATVTVNTTSPEGVTNGRWIDVNLAEQTLAVYDNHQMVYATIIASGREGFWTRPGLFQIYKKKETENMTGFQGDPNEYYYLENVPWTMYFDKARALHGAYWASGNFLGYPQSHGCVNMSIGDAAWLFKWAQQGDWVWVHDPSGKTPTDPAIYGDGGA